MPRITYGGKDAIRNRNERANIRYQCWKDLESLAANGKAKEFFELYAGYLEFDGLISRGRIALHKMAKIAAEKL